MLSAKARLVLETNLKHKNILQTIQNRLLLIDQSATSLSNYEIESLWSLFSLETGESFLNVNAESLADFVNWLVYSSTL